MGKITVETKVLQALVNAAIRGASRDKSEALTNLFDVFVKDGRMSITTTDLTNYLTVYGDAESGADEHFCVQIDKFSKLALKTSTDKVKIDVKEDHIAFTGNGTYKIPFMVDVDGTVVRLYRTKVDNPTANGEVNTSVIRDVVARNKLSLSVDTSAKVYLTGYLCTDDCVMTSDSVNLCKTDVQIIPERAIIPSNVLDILSTSKSDKITYNIGENCAEFVGKDMKVYCAFINGIDEYPEQICRNLMALEIGSKCTLPRTAILNTLNRLELFIDARQLNCVRVTFMKDGVSVATISGDAIEKIEYQGSENFKEFTCLVDVSHFKSILASYDVESLDVEYGNEQVLRIGNNLTTHVIALRRERKK